MNSESILEGGVVYVPNLSAEETYGYKAPTGTMDWGTTFKPRSSDDAVNHPSHYNHGPIEVIDIIEGFDLGFHLGNVVKYVLRADKKGHKIEDLKKARWYLDRLIEAKSKEDH